VPTGLPTTDTTSKAVQDFGIGTYDSSLNGEHGEDDEESTPKALPDDGGPLDPFGPDRLLSYPQDADSQGKHASYITEGELRERANRARSDWFLAHPGHTAADYNDWFQHKYCTWHQSSGDLPGDLDRPPRSRRPADDTKNDVLPTATSKLPTDEDNPAARSDYYDRMQTGQIDGRALSDIWPDEDSGAWATEKTGDTELPGVTKNENSMDDFLGALGNFWSGFEVEDVSGPQGFPATDFAENVDYDRSDNQDGGRLMASRLSGMRNDMNRQATDLNLVGDLTSEFLKKNGKKGLTRRHVMAFLQDGGHPQFLASDIIRCLKHRHKVVVADVLDQFPVAKEASVSFKTAASMLRDKLIQLEVDNILIPEVASVFRRSAADLAHVVADLEKSEDRNG